MSAIFKNFKKLLVVLPKITINHLFLLYFGLIILAFVEIIGLGTIPIFVSMIIDPTLKEDFFGINLLGFLKNLFPFENITTSLGVFIILLFLFKSIYVFFMNFFELSTIKSIRVILANNLTKAYAFRPYIFFLNKNSSNLSRNIITESSEATTFVSSSISIFREISLLIGIFVLLFYFQPLITLASFTFIIIIATVFYYLTDKKLKEIGKLRILYLGEVFKTVSQLFGAIKEIKVFKKESFFLQKFGKFKNSFEQTLLVSELIKKMPRVFFELFSIIFLVTLTILFIFLNKNTSELIPYLSLVAVSTVRLVPSFSSIASAMTWIKTHRISFDIVVDEIYNFKNQKSKKSIQPSTTANKNNAIDIKNLSFSYPGSSGLSSIKDITLNIKTGEMIGIIGKSGVGKSTLVNIMLNLLEPLSGEVNIQNYNLINNKNTIAYIPQDVFLMDDTLRRNVAFGEFDKDIKDHKVRSALEKAELTNFVKENLQGLDLVIGERGIKVSGGEKQRIAIARALYQEPEILVMDEATSSLDNFTEKKIMESIIKLKEKHTVIIIAHRLTTVANCDKVLLIENGKIKDKGTLEELLKRNPYLSLLGKKEEKISNKEKLI